MRTRLMVAVLGRHSRKPAGWLFWRTSASNCFMRFVSLEDLAGTPVDALDHVAVQPAVAPAGKPLAERQRLVRHRVRQ